MIEAQGYEAAQARGDRSAYERYLAGMNASMRQKVALTAAHLLCEGKIADMGMGSGEGSHAMARLYPRLHVVGVDIDPTVVDLAKDRFSLPNLSFVAGDVASAVFEANSLDGIFDSSVLHHVTSYGGYRHDNAVEAMAVHVAQLKPHGVLVIRDFVDPGPGTIWLDLPDNDGDDSFDPRTASTARLLERFAGEFRSLSAQPGFGFLPLPPPASLPPVPAGWRRFCLSRKHAVEFLLRKDYRRDWEAEVKEEYTYLSQSGFETQFTRLGLRVLASLPIRNPWIVKHRFRGRFALYDEAGVALPAPATNFLIVGEKVNANDGVAFTCTPREEPFGFLKLVHHKHSATGRIYDLVSRPNVTIDIIPFFQQNDTVYVLARTNYPRPILAAGSDASLDGSGAVTYVAEPLNVIQTDRPVGATVEQALARAAGIGASHIRCMEMGSTYYPSPGGVLEEVRSVFVHIEPMFVNRPLEPVSGFSSSGRVRAIEARQLLRAAQVGGLPDARLELNVHDLLLRLGESLGPWIGEELQVQSALSVDSTAAEALLSAPRRRAFECTDSGGGFLRIRCGAFAEVAAGGEVLAERVLEFVEPQPLSLNTVACAILARAADGGLLMGVDEDDLPAAQLFNGNSNLLVAPAWRLPRNVVDLDGAKTFVQQRLAEDYGVDTNEGSELGGAYRPSSGVTPEVVFPFAFEATNVQAAKRVLHWVRVSELAASRQSILDGHLRVLSARVLHAGMK